MKNTIKNLKFNFLIYFIILWPILHNTVVNIEVYINAVN